jgi:hypothetical protein
VISSRSGNATGIQTVINKPFVAAQMYEFSYTENPPNRVGGIRELFYLPSNRQSIVSSLA